MSQWMSQRMSQRMEKAFRIAVRPTDTASQYKRLPMRVAQLTRFGENHGARRSGGFDTTKTTTRHVPDNDNRSRRATWG
jgi:hypothetical protein